MDEEFAVEQEFDGRSTKASDPEDLAKAQCENIKDTIIRKRFAKALVKEKQKDRIEKLQTERPYKPNTDISLLGMRKERSDKGSIKGPSAGPMKLPKGEFFFYIDDVSDQPLEGHIIKRDSESRIA